MSIILSEEEIMMLSKIDKLTKELGRNLTLREIFGLYGIDYNEADKDVEYRISEIGKALLPN